MDRFTIRWDDSMGAYRVNVPEWEGGEVVRAEDHDRIVSQLRADLAKAKRAARKASKIT